MKPFKLKEANAKADYSVRELVNNIFDSICNVIKEKPYLGKMTGSQSGFGYFAKITKSLSQYSELFKNDKVYIFITEENESNPASFEKHLSGSLLYMRVLSEDLLNELAILAMDNTKKKELNKVISTKVVKVLEDNRSECIHELIHALDHKRLKNYKGHREEYYTNDETYINDPLEFNAWFQSHLSEIDGIGDYFDDFKKSWQAFYGFCLDSFPFIRNYNEKYRRKFDVRLYKYWKEFIKDGGKKQVNESLKNEGGFFITNSGRDILNLLQNKPKEYRIVYDANLGLFMICDANEGIHADMLEKAYKNGLYYNLDKFIDSLGSFQNYIETGQDGGWDENDNEINSFLYYMVFDPTGQWEIGDDDYDTVYKLPFGNLFTRKCDLSEIPFYNILPLTEQFGKVKKKIVESDEYDTKLMIYKNVEIFKNPDLETLKSLIKDYKELRALWVDGDIYVWNANEPLLHEELEMDKFPFNNTLPFVIRKDGIHNFVIGDYETAKQFPIRQKLYAQKLDKTKQIKNLFPNLSAEQNLIKDLKLNESKEPNINQNFWKWFGNSKTIKNGKPIVYYHRTNADFDTFSKDYDSSLLASGFYFSEKPLSDWYGKNIKECYLKMENPYIINNMDNIEEIEKFVKTFKLFKKKWQLKDIKGALIEYYKARTLDRTKEFDGKTALRAVVKWDFDDNTNQITKLIKDKGYDSLIIKNSSGQDGIVFDEYIVFEPNQIKSVNNNGNWSSASDNINEVIEEGVNDNYLYHAMWKKQFFRCKKEGKLYSHSAYESNGNNTQHRIIKGISMSRNLNVCIKFMENQIKEFQNEWQNVSPLAKMHVSFSDNEDENYVDAFSDLSYVVLVFDRNKLKQNHKIIPHNYIGGRMRDTFGDEQEEVVVGDIPNFMNYVIDVVEFNNNINSKTLKSKKNVVESVNYIDGIEVLINPSKQELQGFMKRNRVYRVLLTDTDMAIWTADCPLLHDDVEYEHQEFFNSEHLFALNGNIFFVDYDMKPDEIEDFYFEKAEKLDNSPIVKKYFPHSQMKNALKMMKKGISMFNAPEDWYGWLGETKEPNLNQNFWHWFGDSKVVDEQGNPQVCIHRTKANFNTFDISKSHPLNLQGKGFYFATVDGKGLEQSFGKNVMKCYLSIQNPFLGYDKMYPRSMFEPYIKKEYLNKIFDDKNEIMGYALFFNMKMEGISQKEVDTTDILIKLGFDGIWLKENNVWVAFYPNQIKSIDNNGNWSKEINNINETI